MHIVQVCVLDLVSSVQETLFLGKWDPDVFSRLGGVVYRQHRSLCSLVHDYISAICHDNQSGVLWDSPQTACTAHRNTHTCLSIQQFSAAQTRVGDSLGPKGFGSASPTYMNNVERALLKYNELCNWFPHIFIIRLFMDLTICIKNDNVSFSGLLHQSKNITERFHKMWSKWTEYGKPFQTDF